MIVYRLSKKKYAKDISGEGAKKTGSNRWNSKGTPMLYTCESPALCALELHQYVKPGTAPTDYYLIEMEVPDTEPLTVENNFFKTNWMEDIYPSQLIGDYFIHSSNQLILEVPSAWIHQCYNYLINPNHPDFSEVKIVEIHPFPFDGKLFD